MEFKVCTVSYGPVRLNPLTPRGDKSVTSPHNIH